MFNSNSGYSLADIAAATGNGNNSGFGFGGDGAWMFLLFILVLLGGWNGNGYGNGGGVGGEVQRGFDQSAVMSSLGDIGTSITNGQFNLANQLNTIAMNQQNCCC